MKKAFLFYDIKSDGEVSEMCGSDCIKPFPDGRMTEHNNRRMIQAYIDMLVKKKGVVGVRTVSWDGIRMGSIRYLSEIEWLIPYDKLRQMIHRVVDDVKILYSGKCIEYEPWRFSRIYNISVGMVHYGYYYEAVSKYDKTWYELIINKKDKSIFEEAIEKLSIFTECIFDDNKLKMSNIDDVVKIINYMIEIDYKGIYSLSDERI